MSNSDELRHTDNTTLVPPRLPDTLLQVYHRRRPTLGLLILPSVPLLSPIIRRTARISVLPIEPNLVERARISAIKPDDIRHDHVNFHHPSTFMPLSRWLLTADDLPEFLEIALTVKQTTTIADFAYHSRGHGPLPKCLFGGVRSLHDTVDELITQLRQMCEDAKDRASNAQEEARQKRKEALEEVVQRIYRNNN
ncbi:hypothetical protein Tco_1245211 [Tanacetum coccineum]